jgi:DnaJ-domain-containing protein 1
MDSQQTSRPSSRFNEEHPYDRAPREVSDEFPAQQQRCRWLAIVQHDRLALEKENKRAQVILRSSNAFASLHSCSQLRRKLRLDRPPLGNQPAADRRKKKKKERVQYIYRYPWAFKLFLAAFDQRETLLAPLMSKQLFPHIAGSDAPSERKT